MTYLAIALIVAAMCVPLCLAFRLMKQELEARRRDNQALMEALAHANGQRLQFSDEPRAISHKEVIDAISKHQRQERPRQAPYFQSKETVSVQVGDKTVELNS